MATQQAFEVGGAELKSSRYRYDHLTMFGVYLSTERSGFEMISLGIEYFIFIFFLVNSEIDVNLIFLTLEVICCSCFMPEGMSRCNKNQAFLPCGSFLKEVIEFDSQVRKRNCDCRL